MNILSKPGALQSLPPLSLYIHLPWCLAKCPYCDFNSHGLSATASGLAVEAQHQYRQALVADLDAALPAIWGRRVRSVFIGGGTPSLFEPEQIDQLLADVRARLVLEPGCEVTLEANPGTFEVDRFGAFRQAGVSRLSIGVQSFEDAKLRALGRVHDARQARAAVHEAQRCFDTFNIDLMYALPEQSLADFEHDLQQALSLEPPHLSLYHLTMEPNTAFASRPPDKLPDEDAAADMLDHLLATTERHGLQRYEVSAYARRGHQCEHNRNYWEFGDYLGIGAGAHSKISQAESIVRQVRWREPKTYMAAAAEGRAVSNEQVLSLEDRVAEYMMNALRLCEGFALADFQERTGLTVARIHAAMETAQAKGLLQRDLQRAWPTARGLDFLSDLQTLFMPN